MDDPAGTTFDVIVLAGGRGRRLGGVDKAAVVVGERALLDRVLACCTGARSVVVVGPRRATAVPVTWTREEPPGSGPLAALAAGTAALPEPPAPTVVLLATDLPHLTTTAVRQLVEERRDDDAVLFVDSDGRHQPLCAAYDAAALRTALGRIPSLHGGALRTILDHLEGRTIPDDAGVTRDIDTPDDLDRATAITEEDLR